MLCLRKIIQNPEPNDALEQRLGWIKSSKNYKNFDRIDGEPTEFEWNIFPGFNTLQLSEKVKSLLYRLGETQRNPQEEFYLCRCSTTFSVDQETMNKNLWQTLDPYLCMPRRFGKGQWSFIGPDSEKKWHTIKEDSPQGIWDKIAERMLLEFAESGCPILRATTPLSRGQFKKQTTR